MTRERATLVELQLKGKACEGLVGSFCAVFSRQHEDEPTVVTVPDEVAWFKRFYHLKTLLCTGMTDTVGIDTPPRVVEKEADKRVRIV